MRALALAALVFIAGGCLDIDSEDGTLVCSTVPGRACPQGWYCAWNDRCYRDGDSAPMPDLEPAPVPWWERDLSSSVPYDMSVPYDFSPPADLTPTAPADLSSSD